VARDTLNQLHVHTGLFANENWLAQNRATAAAFKSAIQKSMNFIAQNDAEARQVLAEYTKIDPAIANKVKFSIAQTEMPPGALQPVIDAAVATGIAEKRIDAKDLIFDVGQK
jgi:ABC-type nitrate/sulfonate/bicarbonate transport system substrate-binding protein